METKEQNNALLGTLHKVSGPQNADVSQIYMKYFTIIAIIICLSSCNVDMRSPSSHVEVMDWSKAVTMGRSSIRVAVMKDRGDGIFVAYEIYGRHDSNEEQPVFHKYSIHIEVADNTGKIINNSVNVMVNPALPNDSDFASACLHGPYRSIIKYRMITENGKKYLIKGINELDNAIIEKYDVTNGFQIRVMYSPISKEYIQIKLLNYLDDAVESEWFKCN